MKIMRVFSLSVLAMAVGACSTIPPKAPLNVVAVPNIPIDKSYELTQKDTISTAQAPSLASIRWQDFYADTKLKALIELGLKHNKDFQKAILAVQSAKAQYRIKEISGYPSVSMSGGVNLSGNTKQSASSTAYSVGITPAYELDLWGKVSYAKEQALHDYLSSNADKDAAQIALISEIAKNYVNLSYALANRHLNQETLKTREHSLFINKKRFEAGIDAKNPSLQAEASVEQALLGMRDEDTAILQLRNALQLLIGMPVPDELMPDMAVHQITTPSVFNAGLPSELLYYRPDIVKAEHTLKKAGISINEARLAYFPSISLSSSLNFSSSDGLKNLFKVGAWSFGPSISLPIFDAGKRRAEYEVAKIAQQSALVGYERSIQEAFREVSDVFATRAVLDEKLERQYRLQKNYQETYKIAHARFRSGLDNYLNVLDAERSLFDSQKSILELEKSRVLSQIDLYKVLGGGASLSAEQKEALQKEQKVLPATTSQKDDTPKEADTPPRTNEATEPDKKG